MGGGNTAVKKAEKLLEYGADLELLAPDIDKRIYKLLPDEKIIKDKYHKKYCQGKLIIIAASNNASLNKEIAKDAENVGALFNAVDQTELCQFIVPAIVKRGDLQIAISTAGKNPALSGIIRKGLEERFGTEFESYLEELGVLREIIKEHVSDSQVRREMLIRMAEVVYEGGRKGVKSSPTNEEG